MPRCSKRPRARGERPRTLSDTRHHKGTERQDSGLPSEEHLPTCPSPTADVAHLPTQTSKSQMFPRRCLRLASLLSPRRLNSTLVLVEHKDGKVVSSTLNTISAAAKLGFPVSALVAGAKTEVTDVVAKAVASTAGISKVIVAKDDKFDRGLPETHAPLIVAAAKAGSFSHVLASHSAYGKNVMPRAAALLDVAQVSDIIAIESPDTFQRPIYAGEK